MRRFVRPANKQHLQGGQNVPEVLRGNEQSEWPSKTVGQAAYWRRSVNRPVICSTARTPLFLYIIFFPAF
jgi:hypothetical protein